MQLRPGDLQVPAHTPGVVVADGDERVDVRDLLADEGHRPRPVGLGQAAQEDVLALQGAVDGAAQGLPEGLGDADQHRVRDVDDVRAGLATQPVDELVELLALMPVRAIEHRHGQPAELTGVGLHAPRDELEQPRRLPQPVEQPRRPAEERDVLLQVDADAAEEDPLPADVLLVGAGRRVEGQQGDVVPAPGQGRRERVVADAASAVHAAGAGRDAGDSHVSSVPNQSAAMA